jgi:transposase
MIAALTVSPRRHWVRLIFALLPNENVDTVKLLPFVRQLRRQIGSPLILVWDRLNVHRAVDTRIRRRCRSIHFEFLPPYAPELNPVEMLWAWLKMNPLANDPAYEVQVLCERAHLHTHRASCDQALLRSFIRATPLSSCLR